MIATVIVYLGLLAMFLGLLCLIWPIRWLYVRHRRTAVLLFVAGVLTFAIGTSLPAREARIDPPQTRLDHFLPAYQFSEFHSIRVPATRPAVYRALKAVTAEDIFLYRTLVWIRRMGRPAPPSIMNPPPNQPLLDVARHSGFLLLADVPGELPNSEIVLGTLVAAPPGWRPSNPTPDGYKALADSGRQGFALAVMNFRLTDCAAPTQPTPCTLLTTETRIDTTDPVTRRRFARYWRVIYPGSSLIRMMWLRAVAGRASTKG